MKYLTRREELILLSIGNLKEDAYLVAIREHLSKIDGKEWSISAIHIPLRRLENLRFVQERRGRGVEINIAKSLVYFRHQRVKR